jgi:hypothetical protein
LHTFAVSEINVEAFEHLSNDCGSLDDIGEILLFEVTDGFREKNLKRCCIFQANLDLIQSVVLDEPLEKPSDKLLHLKNIRSSKWSGVVVCLSGSAVLVSIVLELAVGCAAG